MIIKKVAAFLTAAALLSGSTMFTPYEISETGAVVEKISVQSVRD